MDNRHRGGGGDRYGGSSPDPHHHFNSSKYSRGGGGPPSSSRSTSNSDAHHHYHHHRRSPNNSSNNNTPNNYRGGGSGDRDRDRDRGRDYRRSFDSPPPLPPPPRYPPSPAGTTGGGEGGGWSRPMNSNDRVLDGSGFHAMSPLLGQKRGYSTFSDDIRGPAPPPDRFDGGSFAKLFVGSVPRTATEEDIRPVFEKHGRVLEVALIRDKRTGQQQGCCFIKFATSQEADRAIRLLHNQYTLPGGVGPIQVRYADGERERLGTVEFKLFVGSLNKHATEKEVEEIFAPYGRVEDVYLMRDEMKQSRGCGFVKYSHREMALAAINALNGRYTMRGCDHPLTVRFADPKRPRLGDSRGGAPAFGGPGFGPGLPSPGIRPPMIPGEPMHERFPPNALQPMSPQKPGVPSTSGLHGFGNHFPPRAADVPVVPMPSLPHMLPAGQQTSPLQKPLQSPQHLPSSLQLQQPQNVASFVPPPVSHPVLHTINQGQIPSSAGQTLNQALSSQQLPDLAKQRVVSQPQLPLSASSTVGQASPMSNFPPHAMSAGANQPQLPAQHQSLQAPLQSPSQLAQLLSQQTQTLQASFQSSQQAFSQLQQQLHLMQPSNQSSISQQSLQSAKQQSPWAGTAPQTVGNASVVQPGGDIPAALSANSATPPMSRGGAPLKCNWTEHTSPDGYKYYYNSVTGESKWEKPEELAMYEQQQQQKLPVQHPVVQHSQSRSVQNVPQRQMQAQNHIQTQLQPQNRPQQLQQSAQSLSGPGVMGHQTIQELRYTQLPLAAGSKSMNDLAQFQQVQQPAPDWMWKNKPAGT